MKTVEYIFRMVILLVIGFILATCQKEEAMMLNPEDKNEIETSGLKIAYDNSYVHLLYSTIDNINELVDDGYLNKGNGKALIVKLNAAIQNILKKVG